MKMKIFNIFLFLFFFHNNRLDSIILQLLIEIINKVNDQIKYPRFVILYNFVSITSQNSVEKVLFSLFPAVIIFFSVF